MKLGENEIQNPVPLTILTGFLGAGKTTLLNRILRGDHGLRVAVLVNDFGTINIDTQLVVDVQSDAVSLANGCICCTIRDDLLMTVLQLLKRPEPPEYLIIEASGVSDPVAVATTFLIPEIRPLIHLDSIITVVDAEQARDQPDYAELIEDQIMAADIVIINKIDLASANLRRGLHEWVETLVPRARILEAVQADVPLELLLGAGRYRISLDLIGGSGTADATHAHDHVHDHGETFSTWSYEADRPFAFKRIQEAFKSLPTSIFRAKGVLSIAEAPLRRAILQMVGKRVSLTLGEPWGDTPPYTQLVVIGTPGGVDAAELQARFESCHTEQLVEDGIKSGQEWTRGVAP